MRKDFTIDCYDILAKQDMQEVIKELETQLTENTDECGIGVTKSYSEIRILCSEKDSTDYKLKANAKELVVFEKWNDIYVVMNKVDYCDLTEIRYSSRNGTLFIHYNRGRGIAYYGDGDSENFISLKGIY